MTRPHADNPRLAALGPNPLDTDTAAFAAALDRALSDQDARNAQAKAFLSDVHSGDGHNLDAGPEPNDGD